MSGHPSAWRIWAAMPPLAWRNVRYGGRKTIAAIAGVTFAITMVLLQLGFYGAVEITATSTYEQLDFDVVLLAATYDNFYAPGAFPRERLRQAQSLGSVASAAPLFATFNLWRCPPYPLDDAAAALADDRPEPGPIERWLLGDRLPRPSRRRELFLMGISLGNDPFLGAIRRSIEAARPALQPERTLLLDELSNLDFGWPQVGRFDGWEMGQTAVRVVGGFPLLRGFAADGIAICSDQNFALLCGLPDTEVVQLGLLKLREPGEKAAADACRALRAILPVDVQVLTRGEILEKETEHWVSQTATGKLFAFGVLVAVMVACAVVYQVLSNDVRDHRAEYATLKAMGHTDLFLSRVVIVQSCLYAGVSFVVAVALGLALYHATETLAGIPMRMTLRIVGLTLVLTIVIGLLSAVLSLEKVWRADPAELF